MLQFFSWKFTSKARKLSKISAQVTVARIGTNRQLEWTPGSREEDLEKMFWNFFLSLVEQLTKKNKQTATTKEIGHTKDDSVKGMKLYDQNVISYLDLSLFDAEKWGLESNQERDELLEGKLLMSFPIIFLLQIFLNKSIFSYTKKLGNKCYIPVDLSDNTYYKNFTNNRVLKRGEGEGN